VGATGPGRATGPWAFFGRDPSTLTDEPGRRLFAEASRALPEPYGDRSEEFMPDKPRVGRCRICGETRKLTREHVPPAAALNLDRARVQTVEEWLKRSDENIPGGAIKQGGVWAYTLCKSCNDRTGALYGDEYRRWAGTILNMLAELGTNVRALEAERETRRGRFSMVGRQDPRPGAMVRQILSMMCSVSAGFDLAGRYPAIRRIILDGATEPLPAGLSLGLTVFLSSRSRFSAPMMTLDTGRSMWRWTIEIAHAPLASLLVVASGGDAPAHVWDISQYTQIAPETRAHVEGDLEIGFGNTLYPGDYRSKAGVEADAA
jgi:hypothetical protein